MDGLWIRVLDMTFMDRLMGLDGIGMDGSGGVSMFGKGTYRYLGILLPACYVPRHLNTYLSTQG